VIPWHWGIHWHWVIPITLSDTHYGHTQEDTHYTEWYSLQTHPRGHPLHWMIPITLSDTHYRHTQEDTHYTEWYPLHWVIFPLTDSFHNPPKSLPITLRDPVFLTNKPHTEWYPWHWGISLTLNDTHYPEFLANRISDGRTDRRTHKFSTEKNPFLLYK
jgi:hypothetical protein